MSQSSHIIPELLPLYSLPILFAGLIFCAGSLDHTYGEKKILKKLSWIGESTYGVYLIQTPVQILIICIINLIGFDRFNIINSIWFFCTYIVFVFFLAKISYKYIENPVQNYLRIKLLVVKNSVNTGPELLGEENSLLYASKLDDT